MEYVPVSLVLLQVTAHPLSRIQKSNYLRTLDFDSSKRQVWRLSKFGAPDFFAAVPLSQHCHRGGSITMSEIPIQKPLSYVATSEQRESGESQAQMCFKLSPNLQDS